MDEPEIAARKPRLVTLTAGAPVFWCACGKSAGQPFCDGSHKGTRFTPLRYVPEESGEALLCACKRTKTPPFCDGSHNSLSDAYETASPAEIAKGAGMAPTPRSGAGVSLSVLDGGCFAATLGQGAMRGRGTLSFAEVIGAGQGARFISQYVLEAAPGVSDYMSFGESDVALFIARGSLAIEIAGRRFETGRWSGVHVRAKEAFRFINSGETAAAIFATVCPQPSALRFVDASPCEFDAAFPQRVFGIDPAKRESMGDRFYQVLIGEETGSRELTQFIGEIPLSRAAMHQHLYEEAIMVLTGEGFLWTENSKAAIAPGDIIFLPRKQAHSLECVSPQGMMLMGAFYPAGSPAINY